MKSGKIMGYWDELQCYRVDADGRIRREIRKKGNPYLPKNRKKSLRDHR